MAPTLQWIATRHGKDSSMFVDPFVIKKTDHVHGTGIEDQHQYRCWPIHDKNEQCSCWYTNRIFHKIKNGVSRAMALGSCRGSIRCPTASLPHFTFCFKLAVPSISDDCHVKCSSHFLRASCCHNGHLLSYNRGNFRVDLCGCRFDYTAFASCPGRDQAALEAYHDHGDD